jgi:S-adenosylmethionine decarboxylase
MSVPPVGQHILSELFDCAKLTEVDDRTLVAAVTELIKANNLTKLGQFCHEFDGGGLTALIGLAESHIAFHTWPEIGYVTMEVYVCNHSHDNTGAADLIHEALVKFFAPSRVETHRLAR